MNFPALLAVVVLLLVSVAAESAERRSIDTPKLPRKHDDFTSVATPGYLHAELLQRLDNTPDDNPLTDAGATLGRVLFYDKQLSRNDTIACASCHRQKYAFSDPRRFSVGFAGGHTRRNSMTLTNLRYSNVRGGQPGFFWDERAATLEVQVLMPIRDQVEMGMPLDRLEAKLQDVAYYPPLFQAAFGSPQVSAGRVAKAVAQFMRSMVSFDARFDRAAQAAGGDLSRDFDGFTAEENLGKSLFIDGLDGIGEFGCAHCHVPPTFNMPASFNNGLEMQYTDAGLGALKRRPNDPFTPSNDGKFKAPSLRNIALTAPYMHDGRFQTLREVVEHYSNGVHPHPNLGVALSDEAPVNDDGTSGFGFTAEQKSALVAFLKTLTDESLISEGRFSDPFARPASNGR